MMSSLTLASSRGGGERELGRKRILTQEILKDLEAKVMRMRRGSFGKTVASLEPEAGMKRALRKKR